MACALGEHHTVCLDDTGVLYSFGYNGFGQLGFGYTNYDLNSVPRAIPGLPKIKQVFCGVNCTVCVDESGYVWSFGLNRYGQLGIDDIPSCKTPRQIQSIPPVQYVCCGQYHTLFITDDLNLWSVGFNQYGQLFLGNQTNFSTPQKTLFSNVSKVSAGNIHSFLQFTNGEIIGCGYNTSGSLGLGHYISPQIDPVPILDQPPNITHFCCGDYYVLLLDIEGNVFSVGCNAAGNLGIGNCENQNKLNQVFNIPPIKSIFCAKSSSYLLDFEGNVWVFGKNDKHQLGNFSSDFYYRFPTKTSLKDIQQLPFGYSSEHFFAKDSQDIIHVFGNNCAGQLGMKKPLEKETNTLNAKYSFIWGTEQKKFKTTKSARK